MGHGGVCFTWPRPLLVLRSVKYPRETEYWRTNSIRDHLGRAEYYCLPTDLGSSRTCFGDVWYRRRHRQWTANACTWCPPPGCFSDISMHDTIHKLHLDAVETHVWVPEI